MSDDHAQVEDTDRPVGQFCLYASAARPASPRSGTRWWRRSSGPRGSTPGAPYVRYAEGEFRELEPKPERAASLLGQLDGRALRAFDRETAAGTRETAEAYGERAGTG